MRAEFLGMVGHELRAPLASIKGSAEMVQFFRIINEQADHMRSLISDLLDAGRIEAGRAAMPSSSVSAGIHSSAQLSAREGAPCSFPIPLNVTRGARRVERRRAHFRARCRRSPGRASRDPT